MDLCLGGSVAVVAASSQGIGRAVATRFGEEGARVVINGRRPEVLTAVAAEISEQTGAEILSIPADLSESSGCRQLIDGAVDAFGGIDALVTNSAGPPSTSFASLNDEEWRAAFDLLLMSVVRLIRAALPHLVASHGAVVTLSSISARQLIPGLVLSNSLRPGVIGVEKTLADELGSQGVRFNAVAPGPIWTERARYLVEARAKAEGIEVEEAIKRTEASVPLGRYGRPEEVADLVVFLSSARASYISGSTMLVDGGQYRGLT